MTSPLPNPLPRGERGRVAIIGAGLSGAACANAFANKGCNVTVYEQAALPAAGASGVPIAMFAPSVSADDAPHSRLLRQGVHKLMDEVRRLTKDGLLVKGADWALTGVLERCIRGDKQLPSIWLGPQDPQGLQSRIAGDAYSISPAGHAVSKKKDVQSIWHPMAGWVNLKRLIAAWLAHPHITLKTEHSVSDIKGLQADVIIVACGYQTPEVLPNLKMALQPIRGQLEWGTSIDGAGMADARHISPVNGMGHFISTPSVWVAGATFQRDERELAPRAKDVDLNFEKLAILMPKLSKSDLAALRARSTSWVGVRTAQKNRQPLVQKVADGSHENVWICSGLGSRGLSLAALCAGQLVERVLSA